MYVSKFPFVNPNTYVPPYPEVFMDHFEQL